MTISRRTVLKSFGAAGAAPLLGARAAETQRPEVQVAGRPIELSIAPVGARIVRVSLAQVDAGGPRSIPDVGALAERQWEPRVLQLTTQAEPRSVACGDARVTVSTEPLTVRIEAEAGRLVQLLRIDKKTGALSFRLGDGPVLGLGEGGPQFDRRGSIDRMRSGQGGYRLRTHGGRVPIPWLIGTSGWSMFVHSPTGSFDLSGTEGRFIPAGLESSLPLDIFVVIDREPARIMAEYARLTGLPEMPPLWSFGYQQSHRTLVGREEVLSIARTFREKRLPCDALIYLGTGFCPSGWNTGHGSFTFNPKAFPDPKGMIDELHATAFPRDTPRGRPLQVASWEGQRPASAES